MRNLTERARQIRARYAAQLLAGCSVLMVLVALGAAMLYVPASKSADVPASHHAYAAPHRTYPPGHHAYPRGRPAGHRTSNPHCRTCPGHAVPTPSHLYPVPSRTYPAPVRAYPSPVPVSYPQPVRTYPAPPRRTYPAPVRRTYPPAPRKTYPAPKRTYKSPSPRPTPKPTPTRPTPTPTPTPTLPPPVPLTPPLLGVVTGAATGGVAGWNAFTGHTAQLAVNYVAMGNHGGVLPPSFVQSAIRVDDGATPVIEILPNDATTAPVTLASIASGQHDTWLLAMKAQIAAAGRPVVVSFAPEANGRWYSWGKQPAEFVLAWRHVHNVLGTGTAVAPITFMWQFSAINYDATRHQYPPYWPGAAFVNWVGLDGYYYPKPPPAHDAVFGDIFQATLTQVATFWHGPVIIGETGISPLVTNGPADITNLFAGVAARNLLGAIYFDVKQVCPAQGCGLYHGDFALQDQPPTWKAAFQAALNSGW